MRFILLICCCLPLLSADCGERPHRALAGAGGAGFTVMFYNVENIFDTENDPVTLDDDFTAEGKMAWTPERYQLHLEHTAWVIDAIPGALPDIVGLCEIENRRVVEELASSPLLQGVDYAVVHRDSPDERGIDVALMYNKAVWKLKEEEFLKVTLPSEADPNTRDILYAHLVAGGKDLHVFVNHWPSRREGEKESEPNRIAAANRLRARISELTSTDPSASIVVMGDFNDYPDNTSVAGVLCSGADGGMPLVNLMDSMHRSGVGSYWHQGSWGMLDQIMVSEAIAGGRGDFSVVEPGASVFSTDQILFTDAKGTKRPSRVFVGESYKGGYSDHLPVYVSMKPAR